MWDHPKFYNKNFVGKHFKERPLEILTLSLTLFILSQIASNSESYKEENKIYHKLNHIGKLNPIFYNYKQLSLLFFYPPKIFFLSKIILTFWTH